MPLTAPVLLYGLHDRLLDRKVEWYTSGEAADAELATILNDEPQWATELEIVLVEFTGRRRPRRARKLGARGDGCDRDRWWPSILAVPLLPLEGRGRG